MAVGVVNENYSEREVYLAFLMSMATQVDELYSARHYQMNYYEFLEALARSAEKVSIVLPKKDEKPEAVSQLNYEQKILLSLDRKLKGFLMHIYLRLSDKIKDTFKNNPDDDYLKMDSCMMGEKNVIHIFHS